jgi:hypothetical protein
MPVSLGQAISGKYAQNYDSATPLLKGFQIGAQRRQNDEVARARKEAAKQKQDENFLKQISNSILVKGIDDLDKPAYQEAVGGIFAEAQKLAESGDPDSYVQRMKLLGQIPVINQNFQSRGKALEDLRIAYNKGELGSEDMENASEMFRVGDPRKLKGKQNKLFADPITKGFAPSVTEDGMMVKSPYNRVNVNKYMDDYIGKMGTQNIARLQSAYPTMYQNIKGIPSDQAQLKQLAGADYAKLQNIMTMEDFAANAWKNNQDLQNTYLDNNRNDLLEKFGGENIPINQNPKAMEYARAKFIDEQKNRAKAEMKLEGIKQVSNGGKNNNNYANSYTNLGGGSFESNGIIFEPKTGNPKILVLSKRKDKNKDPEVLNATIASKKGNAIVNQKFAVVKEVERIGDNSYILRGVDGDNNSITAYGVSRQQIATSIGGSNKDLENQEITFNAEQEESLRRQFLKDVSKQKNINFDTEDNYANIFKGDKIGQPTYSSSQVKEWYANKTKGNNTAKKAVTPSGVKMSFPDWKKANPNGTAAEYKKYKG